MPIAPNIIAELKSCNKNDVIATKEIIQTLPLNAYTRIKAIRELLGVSHNTAKTILFDYYNVRAILDI